MSSSSWPGEPTGRGRRVEHDTCTRFGADACPPEPFRYAVVQLTRWSMAHSDAHAGRPNLWLRAMDKLGLGFDF